MTAERKTAAAGVVVGVDIGGTNFRLAVFRGPTAVAEHREPVGSPRDPVTIAERIAARVTELAPGAAPVGVGIAAMLGPGDDFVSCSPHLGWRDVAFGALLRDRLPGRTIAVYNDVNAITYGEWLMGAGRGATDLVAVFVGTGIGSGIIADGRLIEGARKAGAEVGHVKVVLDDNARPCNCGLSGCVEAYVGGAYLGRRVRDDLEHGARSLIADLAGGAEPIGAAHIDQAATRGDPYARQLWHEVAPLLGASLANLCTTLNPQRLILGGGVLANAPTLRGMAVDACRRYINPPALAGLDIVDAELADRAGVVGSALLVQRPSEPISLPCATSSQSPCA
jgi:glucokinase